MKKLPLYLTLLMTYGCQSGTPSQTSLNGCPEEPKIALSEKNVKQISLNNQTVKESGQVSVNTSVGYTFEAKSGQKLTYRTNPALCVWIYAPDTQLLKNGDLPQTGKYTLQVSAPQGSTTFDLEMTLGTLQASSPPVAASTATATSTSTPISTTTYIPPSTPEPQRPAANEFIRNHYIAINNRQYKETWNDFLPEFKKVAGSYFEYVDWWDSVREVRIGDISLVSQNSDSAVVNAELWYVLKKNGRVFKDEKNRIYLRWSEQSKSWLFAKKLKP